MKNIKLLLFLLCGFLLCSNIVKAEGPFLLDWQTEKETGVEFTNNIPFKDGYVVYNLNYNESSDWFTSKIVYYDKTGKEIKSVSEPVAVASVRANGDYLYVLYQTATGKVILEKYDSTAKKVKDLVLANESRYFPIYDVYEGYDPMNIGDKVAIYGVVDGKITIVDKELKEVSEVRNTNSNYKKYFPEYYEMEEAYDELDLYSFGRSYLDIKDNQLVYTTNENSCYIPKVYGTDNGDTGNNTDPEYTADCYKAYLGLADEDYNEVWEKEFDDYMYLYGVKFIDNYIVVGAQKFDSQKGDLLVFDMKGNLVQTINNKSFYQGIEKTPSGFIVTETTCPSVLTGFYASELANVSIDLNGIRSAKVKGVNNDTLGNDNLGELLTKTPRECETNHQVYYIFHKIETKITKGKGKIEVIGQQKPGEPVTFKVTPEEGYVLSKVIVTDANGNTVVFTDNVFTMPSADVTIEAVFVKKSIIPVNPDTAVLSTIVLIAALGSFGLMLYFNKKYQFLK